MNVRQQRAEMLELQHMKAIEEEIYWKRQVEQHPESEYAQQKLQEVEARRVSLEEQLGDVWKLNDFDYLRIMRKLRSKSSRVDQSTVPGYSDGIAVEPARSVEQPARTTDQLGMPQQRRGVRRNESISGKH